MNTANTFGSLILAEWGNKTSRAARAMRSHRLIDSITETLGEVIRSLRSSGRFSSLVQSTIRRSNLAVSTNAGNILIKATDSFTVAFANEAFFVVGTVATVATVATETKAFTVRFSEITLLIVICIGISRISKAE